MFAVEVHDFEGHDELFLFTDLTEARKCFNRAVLHVDTDIVYLVDNTNNPDGNILDVRRG